MTVRALAAVLMLGVSPAWAQPGASPPPPTTRPTAAQAPDDHPVTFAAASALLGGLAGLGLAVAIVQPDIRALGASDELVTPAAAFAGMAMGLVAYVTGRSDHAGRIRASAGTSTAQLWEYSLAFRVPVAHPIAVEAVALVANETWEQTDVQQRCNLGICVTGDVLIDARYEQVVSGLVRVVVDPWPTSPWRPSLAVGGGPARVAVERLDQATELRTGMLLDATVGVEPHGWTVEVGLRVGALDTERRAETAGYFRLGYTWGAL